MGSSPCKCIASAATLNLYFNIPMIRSDTLTDLKYTIETAQCLVYIGALYLHGDEGKRRIYRTTEH